MTGLKFSPFPLLITERLTLRQLSTRDQQDIFALRSNPDVNKYLDRKPANSIGDAIEFINVINDNVQSDRLVYWVITLNSTNEFAGTIGLFSFSGQDSSCEIGYELLPRFQGQGIMEEAAGRVIAYAIDTIGIRKIAATSHTDNVASTGLLMKLGFGILKSDPGEDHLSVFVLNRSKSDG